MDVIAISDDAFERLAENAQITETDDSPIEYNKCSTCNIYMRFAETENHYYCPQCAVMVKIIGGVRDCSEDAVGASCIDGSRDRRYYNVSQDYAKTQIKQTFEYLVDLNTQYPLTKIPRGVLHDAASDYAEIQRVKLYEHQKSDGATKKFVRRSNMRGKILGTLIYYKCIQYKTPRKKSDIATFMKLQTNGISEGEDLVKNFCAEGVLSINIDIDTTRAYTERYLEILHIDGDPEEFVRARDFVIDLIAAANDAKVGMNSVSSSKVIGSIWVYIKYRKLPISINEIEEKCDRVRKNTFTGFSAAIERHILLFIDVFVEYKVPHGFEGRLAKVWL